MKNIYYLLVFSTIFYFHSALYGQNTAARADDETLRIIREADNEKGKETGALILLKDYHMTINEKGQSKMVIRILGKIYSKDALADYSQIPLNYNSYYEIPNLNYAYVIQTDGTLIPVPKDAVQIKTTPESQGLQYTDNKYLSFALSGLEIGAAFDFQITFTQKAPQIEGEWCDNHWFGGMIQNLSPPYTPRIDPVMMSRYTLLVPKGVKFQYHMYSAEQEPLKEVIGTQDKYQWVFTDLHSIKVEESMPNLSTIGPTLILSSLKDWRQIDEWASKKLMGKIDITGSAGIKARELTVGMENDEEKIKAIFNYIQTNIRYIYADLDRGGYTPHSTNEIFNSRYGDCKDKSILLVSMLRAVGIEAYPALINPFPYDQYTDIPAIWFSHLITYIPHKDSDIWLDVTSEVTPFPDLFFADQGRMTFIVNGKGGKLTKTPVAEWENVSVFDLKSSFNTGEVSISMKFKSKGMHGDLLKALFKKMNAEEREQAIKALYKSHFERKEDKVELSDVSNPEIPFSMGISYHADSVWEKGYGIFTYGSHSGLPLIILLNIDSQSSPEIRKNDVVNPYPFLITGSENYVPPQKDMIPLVIPKADSIKNEFFKFFKTFSIEGGAIRVKWTLSYDGKIIPKEKYISYTKSLGTLREKINWKVSFVDPVNYIISLLKSENPNQLLLFSNQILQDDPKNMMAYIVRGAAYDKLNQEDDAVKAFTKAIEINPGSKYAHLFMTFASIIRNNPVIMEYHLNKAIEIDPDYEPALLDRSMLYSSSKKYLKALFDIDQVLDKNPRSVRGLELKGSVYYRMGKIKESNSLFEEALKVDTNNLSLYNLLAQNYLTIDSCRRAIELYSRSVRIDSTNFISLGNLGWAWYKANDDKKCIEYSQKAMGVSSKAYFAKYNLALATLRSGNVAEAKRLYSQLNNEGNAITAIEKENAKKDLIDLRSKGVHLSDIKSILRNYF
jgi:tetratricopeptide (TPR) repeat protein